MYRFWKHKLECDSLRNLRSANRMLVSTPLSRSNSHSSRDPSSPPPSSLTVVPPTSTSASSLASSLSRSRYTFDGDKEGLNIDGTLGTIYRDLARTYPRYPLFTDKDGAGQILLASILKSLSLRFPEIGYCQGMNYVAATLLVVSLGGFDHSLSSKQISKAYNYLNTTHEEEDVFW